MPAASSIKYFLQIVRNKSGGNGGVPLAAVEAEFGDDASWMFLMCQDLGFLQTGRAQGWAHLTPAGHRAAD